MESELPSKVESNAEAAEKLSFCRGLKLLHVRDQVIELLGHIGKGEIFEQYTTHDISHIDGMFKIIEWLIPKETQDNMTSAEWLMLTLAVYFHDLGMVVTKTEYNNKENSLLFKEYKENICNNEGTSEYGEFARNQEDDKFLYQEFVRENHAKRIRQWIENSFDVDIESTADMREIIDDMLKDIDKTFKDDLAMICESHHRDDIDDFNTFRVDSRYGSDLNEKVNLNYIAVILRIADLLHITDDRAPSITRKLINVSNPKSVIEWEKQNAVKAIVADTKRNDANNKDDRIEKDTIQITAYFDGADTAEAYFGLSSYLQYTRKELRRCNEIVEKARNQEASTEYKFPWREIDESRITVKGFETKKLQFTIAQDNILQLLVGHTLYNDSSVVVRELVQNAVDAVRLEKRKEDGQGKSFPDGKVQVDWNKDQKQLTFWDNGTGMTISDVENFLLKVGASKYREDSIKKQFPEFSSISHFGIGILTCFMVANDIDIITNSIEQGDVNCINLRKVNGSYLLKRIPKGEVDERIREHGTMVKLFIRNDVDMSDVEYDLKKWIVVPEIPVYYTEDEKNERRIGYDSLKEMLQDNLSSVGINVDGINYDVFEKSDGKVSLAFAVAYQKCFSDWRLLGIPGELDDQLLPIGTCVEGIRVEFSTPGIVDHSILAIANITNSKYQTNVARSSINLDANSEIISSIYNIYREYVEDQMNSLEKKDYSKSWVIKEAHYLMRPLLSPIGRYYVIPKDANKDVVRQMAKTKCIMLESDGKRSVVSAEQAHEMPQLCVLDSHMTRSIESLLMETKSETSIKSILDVVCDKPDFINYENSVFCGYEESNPIHRYVMSNKEVEQIQVERDQRLVKYTYSLKNDLWYEFEMQIERTGYVNKSVFVPKNDFSIAGLEDEVGVMTDSRMFLHSGSELYRYLKEKIQFFQNEKGWNNEKIAIFLSVVFDKRILEGRYSKDADVLVTLNKVLADTRVQAAASKFNIWEGIDMEEFKKVVLSQDYSFYSTNIWSRR